MTAPVSLAEQIAAVERAQIRVAAAIDMIGQFAPDHSYVDHCMSSAAALRAAAETLKRMQDFAPSGPKALANALEDFRLGYQLACTEILGRDITLPRPTT